MPVISGVLENYYVKRYRHSSRQPTKHASWRIRSSTPRCSAQRVQPPPKAMWRSPSAAMRKLPNSSPGRLHMCPRQNRKNERATYAERRQPFIALGMNEGKTPRYLRQSNYAEDFSQKRPVGAFRSNGRASSIILGVHSKHWASGRAGRRGLRRRSHPTARRWRNGRASVSRILGGTQNNLGNALQSTRRAGERHGAA